MERNMINDSDLENVNGGSIIFNAAHTTCGRNCNDQYAVLNYNDVLTYIAEHRHSMSEKTMLQNMLDLGYIQNL